MPSPAGRGLVREGLKLVVCVYVCVCVRERPFTLFASSSKTLQQSSTASSNRSSLMHMSALLLYAAVEGES